MNQLSSKSKALFLVLGIFVLGLACGALAERWFVLNRPQRFGGNRFGGRPGGGPPPVSNQSMDRMLRRISGDLKLTQEQQAEIREILEGNREVFSKIRQKVREETRSQEEATREKIGVVLSPDQQEKYREIQDRMRRPRGGQRGPGPPRGRPGPSRGRPPLGSP